MYWIYCIVSRYRRIVVSSYEHPDDTIVLPRLNCELLVSDIYADIELIPDIEDDQQF